MMAELSWMGVFCSAGVVSQVAEVKQENLTK
jgi:hypothetical protein